MEKGGQRPPRRRWQRRAEMVCAPLDEAGTDVGLVWWEPQELLDHLHYEHLWDAGHEPGGDAARDRGHHAIQGELPYLWSAGERPLQEGCRAESVVARGPVRGLVPCTRSCPATRRTR